MGYSSGWGLRGWFYLNLFLSFWWLRTPGAFAAPGEIPKTTDITTSIALVDGLIERYGAEHVLLGFDFDHTIAETEGGFGGDGWFRWQLALIESKADRSPLVQTVRDILLLQNFIMEIYPTRLLQPEIPRFIAHYQRRKVPSIIVTSRNPIFRDLSKRDLKRFRIDMGRTALGGRGEEANYLPYDSKRTQDFGLPPDAASRYGLPREPLPVRYENGIFFTAGQHKGGMLRTLLARTGKHPRAVVFFDDTLPHLEGLQTAFADTDVEMHGVHYIRSQGQSAENRSQWGQSFDAIAQRLEEKMRSRSCVDWLFGLGGLVPEGSAALPPVPAG